jgi:ferredoxin-NADP reductase
VGSPAAQAFWLGLYGLAFGSLIAWRVVAPMRRAARHRLRVAQVLHGADGTATVVMAGRHMEDWFARPGQFFVWRFLAPGLWGKGHPYSLSAAPDGRTLRISVKASGGHSAAVAALRPGVRVYASGPFGRFTHRSRTRHGVVLVGAGIGVAPLRAMLEDPAITHQGPCHMIVRARTVDEAPLLDEIAELARARGVTLHVLTGRRGRGWSPAERPERLDTLVPGLRECDVFVCGPAEWSQAVADEARASGVADEALHIEAFAW